MNSTKINNIKIEGIGGITELNLSFQDGLNLICGTNGIGKTTILECISHAFIRNNTQRLKRNVNYSKGTCHIQYTENTTTQNISYELTHFNPVGETDYLNKLSTKSSNILVFNAQRTFEYFNLQNISRDPQRDNSQTASYAYSGISANDIKNWFIQRFMWSAHINALKPEQAYNLEIAKTCFNTLDNDVSFSKVLPDTYDIMIKTPQGEVYFEYLSSGYKSCIYILLGIIKEIEYRFKDPYINVTDFSGIILIDEIDIHLHPQWQESLITSLKNLLPNAQIIATTHSPSMIQCAKSNEIIPLQFDENQKIIVKNFSTNDYGFQGWSIEEILTDVMGMKSTRSELFTTTMSEFDKYLDKNDIVNAKKLFNRLSQMLHPSNPLRKLLEIEMIGVDTND